VYVSVLSSAPTPLFLCSGTCSLVVGGSPTLTLETAQPQSSSLGYTPELNCFSAVSQWYAIAVREGSSSHHCWKSLR